MTRHLNTFGLALASLVLPGCLVVVDFDPFGSDATIEARWTIDGATPTAANCAELGIDRVRVAFYDSVDAYYDTTLEASCAAGVIAPTAPVLAAGTYSVRVEAWRGGAIVGSGNMQTVTATIGGHVRLATTDFTAGGSFDPRGNDASVSGSWTIEGAAPTAASCDTLGIDRVRLVFLNGTTPYLDTTFEAACEAGGFDTRPERVLRAGDYTVRFEAVRDGEVVGQGAMTMVTATVGGHVTVAPADFTSGVFDPRGTDATLVTGWTLNGRTPTSSACWAVGIDDVRVVLFAPDDTSYENGVEVLRAPCAMGFIDTAPTRVVRAGTYLVSLELLDEDDNLVGSYDTEDLYVVEADGELNIEEPDFVFPTTLTVGLDWIRPPGGASGVPGTCAEAGVGTLNYTLIRMGSGPIIDSGGEVACGELISFNSEDDGDAGFGGGTYRLYFEGFDAGGTKRWAVGVGMCDGIVVDDGELVSTQCVADYLP